MNKPQESKPEASPNIHQRILAVIAELGKVDKDGMSAEGYHHHKIDTIVGALRPLLVKHGVLMTYSAVAEKCHLESIVLQKTDAKGRPRQVVQSAAQTVTEITLWNVDDPADKLTALSWGQGLNNSDKAAAIAISYSLKSWLLATFQLRGQEDAESHGVRRGPDAGKAMNSKFAGKCNACGEPYAAGDPILYKKGDIRHQVCPRTGEVHEAEKDAEPPQPKLAYQLTPEQREQAQRWLKMEDCDELRIGKEKSRADMLLKFFLDEGASSRKVVEIVFAHCRKRWPDDPPQDSEAPDVDITDDDIPF